MRRVRGGDDLRRSPARITRKGLQLVEAMRPAVEAVHAELGKRMSAREARELSRLLENIFRHDD